ncbi:MAG TPA: hypothetical protein VFB49_00015 [Patescibacteria group bacterium]|nr:hypothetical protein [Patescibacteria group bacterium]
MSVAGAAPTRGDRFLLGALLLVLALLATISPIRNYDYWWHLKTGALILEQGSVPRADPFSFTAAGTPWVDHEWLFQVAAYLGHTRLGPSALVLLKVLLVIGLCAVMTRHLRLEGHGPAGVAVFLTATLVGAAFRIDVRPELVTLILLPLSIDLVLRARRRGMRAPLLAVVALTALGANMHVGIVLLPVMLAAGAAGTAAAGLLRQPAERSGGARFARRLAWTALGSALAVGINPYGFKLYEVPFELRRLLAGLPWPNLEWAAPQFGALPLFFVVLGLGLLIVIAGLKDADPVATPAWLLSAALALLHARNVGLFFMLLPWGVGRPARALIGRLKGTDLYDRATRREAFRPGFIVAAVLLIAGVPLLLFLPPRPAIGLGVAAGNEPEAAASFLEREHLDGRVYNDVRFGGYLIWRRFPGTQVFIDSRNEIYGDLLRDIAGAMATPDAWRALIDREKIDAAFLRYPPTLQKVVYAGMNGAKKTGERAFSAAYFPATDWALVYWDDDAMIFVRRTPEHADLIQRRESVALNPDDWQYAFAGVLIGRIPVGRILDELQRKLAEDPGCVRARDLLQRFARFAPPSDGAAAGRASGR